MKALVYQGKGKKAIEDRFKPVIQDESDAIVKITKTTICGTDLHILKGDVSTCAPGRILGHEGIGMVDQIGKSVSSFSVGDQVLISCISACSKCENCRRGMYSHCAEGGWMLGNTIDGTQAEYVRIPHADTSLYKIPDRSDDAFVMLSDILPTGFECGVLNGKIQPGSTVAIVGAGPIGLAVLLTAQLYSPSLIIMVDKDKHRLDIAKQLGATHILNSSSEDIFNKIRAITKWGVDTAIEAVGLPETFVMCENIVAPGGTIANIGVHGVEVPLHLERLWSQNITLTTKLVDTVTTPTLLKMVSSKKIDPAKLVSHHFNFEEIMEAYETFEKASKTRAIKMIINM
ncbi:zinc-dependent alcohol dehydrogenase family protein [Legionella fairfieldensis]|uniref:zinc-dependent alcohol dehydrogenase family protein n=1 Tax=Legionella fairfieldensis TaxID=45064 RepID=UPI000491498E|nr:zinc-dependent alcohol dehydrogenase family protein [Legionella fairfieldensis]